MFSPAMLGSSNSNGSGGDKFTVQHVTGVAIISSSQVVQIPTAIDGEKSFIIITQTSNSDFQNRQVSAIFQNPINNSSGVVLQSNFSGAVVNIQAITFN